MSDKYSDVINFFKQKNVYFFLILVLKDMSVNYQDLIKKNHICFLYCAQPMSNRYESSALLDLVY